MHEYPRKIRTLIAEAEAAGLHVAQDGSRMHVRTGKTMRSPGLMLYPDGTAVRSDMDLTATTTIRTLKAMRSVLGLKGAK